jgi:hypothetical protein
MIRKPKKCWHCQKPVRGTVGKSELCKKCIALAKSRLVSKI